MVCALCKLEYLYHNRLTARVNYSWKFTPFQFQTSDYHFLENRRRRTKTVKDWTIRFGQLCLALDRPNRQTTDSFFFLNPDRQTSGRESGQNPDSGQIPDRFKSSTDNGQHFFRNTDRILAADRIETYRIWTADRFCTGHDSSEIRKKRDKDRTRTVLSADVWYPFEIFWLISASAWQ